MTAMSDADEPTLDPRKVRIGLAMVTVVVLIAIVGLVLIEAPAGKALMFAIAAIGFVRAFLLRRWLKAQTAAGTLPGGPPEA
jgi:hypothetical protein